MQLPIKFKLIYHDCNEKFKTYNSIISYNLINVKKKKFFLRVKVQHLKLMNHFLEEGKIEIANHPYIVEFLHDKIVQYHVSTDQYVGRFDLIANRRLMHDILLLNLHATSVSSDIILF